MKVTCGSCEKVLNIPDEKIPAGKEILIKCPNCQAPVTVYKNEETLKDATMPKFADLPEATPTNSGLMEKTQNIPIPAALEGLPTPSLELMMDSLEDEMDFLEEGSQRALVADTDHLESISPALRKMDHVITAVKTAEEGIAKLRVNQYDIVILNERFAECDPNDNTLLRYIEPITMKIRRKMFVVLVGKNFRSLDKMIAFSKSVNLVLNEDDFTNFELILKKSMKENENFYYRFKKLLVESGREVE